MKVIQTILILIITVFALNGYSQIKTKTNIDLDAFSTIVKIFKFSNNLIINGGHKTGSLNGRSEFNFEMFPRISVISELNGMRQIERGGLSNVKYQTLPEGDFNTKSILADWGPSDNPKYGKFKLYLTNDQNKNEVFISISGKSIWSHWTRIELSLAQFQELVNILSISGKPKDIAEIRAKESALKNIIISNPRRIGKILVACCDFPEKMKRDEAKKACEKLGNGWRLPNFSELQILYFNKSRIGKYNNDLYWSSSVNDWTGDIYALNFKDSTLITQNIPGYVRPVKYFNLQRDILDDTVLIKKIKGVPFEIGRLLVSQFDFSDTANWNDANEIAASFGSGWRLPTKEELNILYLNKEKIGGFKEFAYWSGLAINNEGSWAQSFKNGEQAGYYNFLSFYIRPVCEVPVNHRTIIIENLEIAHIDFLNTMNWEGANFSCFKLKDGWRLPTKDELNILYLNKEKIGGFKLDGYWSATEESSDMAWYQYFTEGGQWKDLKKKNFYVRAVRTVR